MRRATTAAFLEHLLFEMDVDPARILILATMRDGRHDAIFRNALVRMSRYEGRSYQQIPLGPLGENELRDFLGGRLAGYKVPRTIRFSGAPLPRNASEKLHKLKVKEAYLEAMA